jgi:class 3 adenylate cyclase
VTSSTVTVLFSDVVGSTELLGEPGERPDEVRRSIFGALRKAVAAHGGEEVKNLGDGLMVAFRSTVEAVCCAVAMQQAVFRLRPPAGGRPVQIRVGVSLGEATVEGGDYFGPPVVEAARLCATAEAGQVLVSDLVRALVGARVDAPFRSVGALPLKGLPEPVAASEVVWAPAGELPLPAALEAVGQSQFVGRSGEVAVFEALARQAADGQRRTVLVAGEPGIGKTRLVAAAATAAHARGATVLYGRCDPDMGVPYQPFAQALRHYVRCAGQDVLEAHAAACGGEVGRLVPELAQRVPGVPPPVVSEPESDRLRLFEAVDALLSAAARDTTVVVVVDDLHWAARPSLLLLCHLARSFEPGALLLVGTYRDTDLSRTHPVTAALAELHRTPSVRRLHLQGLDEAEVRSYMARAAGHELDQRGHALASRVHAETRGNPLFVGELLRHLAETGAIYRRDGTWTSDLTLDQLGIPDGLREVVGGRLSRLSEGAYRVLLVAAVAGAEFGPDLVAETGEAGDLGAVLEGLDEALRAGLVVQLESGTARCFAFAHAVVRQTIYSELTGARRAVLHQRVGRAIERLHGSGDPAHVAALAHHFCMAAAAGESGRAADYALEAARLALDQVAHEAAVARLEQGLAALDTAERPDQARRCDLLLALAQARLRSFDLAGIREASLAAAEAARSVGDPEKLAEAAYWYSARVVAGSRDDVGTALCEEALAAVGDRDPALRARVLAVLAQYQAYAGDRDRGDALSREALELAARTGDAEALAVARFGRYHVLWGTERAAEQVALAEQLLTAPVVTPSGWLASVDAHRLVTVPKLALGDVAGFDAGCERLDRIGRELRSRYFLMLASLWRGCRALMEGRFADVDAMLGPSFELAGDDRNFRNAVAGQLFHLSFERGTLRDLQPLLASVIATTPGLVGFQAALALTHAEGGDLDDARRVFEGLAAGGFSAVPRDLVWPGAMAILCEVAAALGDAERAAALHDLLRPHAGLLVVVANASYCPGAVDRYLGMTAAVAGDLDEADARFAAALALEDRVAAAPLAARTRYWYGRTLLARGGPGDAERARSLLADSAGAARRLGMARLADQAQAPAPILVA